MKLTHKQLEELARAVLGAEAVEVVDDDSKSDFNLDEAINAIDASRSDVLKPRWAQESEERIRSEVAGKSAGLLRTALSRTTGIDKSLLKDLKDEEAVRVSIEHWGKTLNKSQEDIQKMIDEISESKDREWSEKLTLAETERNEWKGKYDSRNRIEALQAELKSAPLPERYDRSIAAQDLDAYLSGKYVVKYNEQTKKNELYQKDNPEIPAMNGSQRVQILDEAKSFFEPRNNWLTDTRTGNAAQATQAATTNNSSFQQQQQSQGQQSSYQEQLAAATASMAQQMG